MDEIEYSLMTEFDKQNLIIAFKTYYNFGIEGSEKNKVDTIISKKANGELIQLKIWKKMISKLEDKFSLQLKNDEITISNLKAKVDLY